MFKQRQRLHEFHFQLESSLQTIMLSKFFVILKYVIFLGLFAMAGLLTWEVILKYKSKDSSLKQSQVQISELPTITICFSPINNGSLVFGKDFTISKYNNFVDYNADKVSRSLTINEGHNPREKVQLSIITTGFEGECYQFHSTADEVERGTYQVIAFDIRNDEIDSKVWQSIKVLVSSELNKLGALNTYWLDGEILEFNIQRDMTVDIGLRETEVISLEEKSGCLPSEPSFFDCFFPLLYKKDFRACPKKCLPYFLPGL